MGQDFGTEPRILKSCSSLCPDGVLWGLSSTCERIERALRDYSSGVQGLANLKGTFGEQ